MINMILYHLLTGILQCSVSDFVAPKISEFEPDFPQPIIQIVPFMVGQVV